RVETAGLHIHHYRQEPAEAVGHRRLVAAGWAGAIQRIVFVVVKLAHTASLMVEGSDDPPIDGFTGAQWYQFLLAQLQGGRYGPGLAHQGNVVGIARQTIEVGA